MFNRAVTAIMKDIGRPLPREDIRDELAKRGIVFGGKEPINAISTKLWRARDRFRLIPGQGYWLADAPVPSERVTGGAAAAEGNGRPLIGQPAGSGATIFN